MNGYVALGIDAALKTKKLLIVGPNLQKVGGATTHLRRLLTAGCCQNVALVTFGRETPPLPRGTLDGNYHLDHRDWRGYVRSAQLLAQVIRQERPDAIFAFGIQPLLVTHSASLWAVKRVPIGYYEISRPMTALRHGRSGFRRQLLAFAVQAAILASDVVGVNSLSGKHELEALIGGPSPRIRLLRNFGPPISTKLSLPQQAQHADLRIIVMGRLIASKRMKDVVDACAELRDKENFHLTIVGDGPEKENLRHHVRTRGLDTDVTFRGAVTDVMDGLAEADVLVCSSAYEGYPNVVIEALASGVPVVSTIWGDDASDLESRGVVLTYPAGDARALAKQLLKLASSTELRAQLSRKGVEEAETKFTGAAMSLSYRQFFHDLLTLELNQTNKQPAPLGIARLSKLFFRNQDRMR